MSGRGGAGRAGIPERLPGSRPVCHGRRDNSLRRPPQSKRKYWQQMVKANVPILLQGRVCYRIWGAVELLYTTPL
uniref:Uncharacterized protein n=1 Tax=Balaenoptera musculus TaxID=9771 RepID=A0A8C0CQ89_BALMU